MLDRLKEIEKISLELEGNIKLRKQWKESVDIYAEHFLQNVNEINAFNEYNEDELKKIKFELNDEPEDIGNIIEQLEKDIDKPGLNPASGGHIAYIPGGGVYPTALGDYLAAVYNKYAGIYYASPGVVKLENSLIRWMCSAVGYPESSLGNLTSGGSIATLIAVATARDVKKISGMTVAKSVIYMTEQVHHSADKAIRIAGMNDAIVRYVPIDSHFRMDVNELDQMIIKDKNAELNPFLIISSAGTTDTGAIDPLDKISQLSEKYDLWHHCDAAYGGFFILLDEYKNKFKGIEESDSVTIDPHKGLFLSYGTGAVLIKDVSSLHQTHKYQANYLQDEIKAVDEPSPAELSPELTKHFRGLRMWMPLKLMGLRPFKAALEEKILLTHYFYEEVQKIGFEVGPFPDLSVMIYRYVPDNCDADKFNMQIIEKVKKDGRVFISSTKIKGTVWLRLAVLSFRTHKSTIDTAIEVLKESLRSIINI